MERTQVLVHRWGGGVGGAEPGFWRSFADGLNQSLVSFLAWVRSETALNRTFPFTYDFKVTPLQAFFAA